MRWISRLALLCVVLAACGGKTAGRRIDTPGQAGVSAGGSGGSSGSGGAGTEAGSGMAGTMVDSDASVGTPTGTFDAGTASDRNMVTPGQICDRMSTIQCAGEAACCASAGRSYEQC